MQLATPPQHPKVKGCRCEGNPQRGMQSGDSGGARRASRWRRRGLAKSARERDYTAAARQLYERHRATGARRTNGAARGGRPVPERERPTVQRVRYKERRGEPALAGRERGE
ncbi:Protein of unknown function [Gryllus bimaculatus]|nr:Protein of unknown function [Gryllus bimaculatus]